MLHFNHLMCHMIFLTTKFRLKFCAPSGKNGKLGNNAPDAIDESVSVLVVFFQFSQEEASFFETFRIL